ncbi:G-protein coupled receptor 157-like [Sycon ciliatum]|uniref:G-protein coupled receptor 157-like n=1 Tax=Sycon ciliatum TaxID=27933 RepID=UPI0020ACCCC9|eukprot:scpid6363/ scgid24669/ 
MDSMDSVEYLASSNTANVTAYEPSDALKYSILAVCVLSFFGSSLIIISYILFKTIRSRSRHILVCLSVADLGVAVSNGTGLLASHSPSICQGQAAAATFFGASCLLWTIALAVYLYAAVVLQWQVIKNVRVMVVFYVICWGIPLAVTCTLIGMQLLGGRPSSITGWQGWWCVLKPGIGHVKSTVFIFLASELWAYLAYILVPILYFRTRFHIQKETKAGEQFVTSGSVVAVQAVDRKLMLLPMLFILLHIWSSIMTVRQMYYMFSDDDDPQMDRPKTWYQTLHFLQGVGDSAQGFCNGLLFVVFTKKVRQHYLNMLHRQRDIQVYTPPQAAGWNASPLQRAGGSPGAGLTAISPAANDSGIADPHSLNSSDSEATPLIAHRHQ